MAISIPTDKAHYDMTREQAMALSDQFKTIVEEMKAGRRPANAPWGDSRFQATVAGAFYAMGKDAQLVKDVEVTGRTLRKLLGLDG